MKIKVITYVYNYMYIAVTVHVQFEFEAMEPGELTIHVGDVIKNCRPVGDGWMEGELNGKIGVFPEINVVKLGMCIDMYVCMHTYISKSKQCINEFSAFKDSSTTFEAVFYSISLLTFITIVVNTSTCNMQTK